MGDKTSYRRMNRKVRNPMAEDLGTDKYHQRVLPRKKKMVNAKVDEEDFSEDDSD